MHVLLFPLYISLQIQAVEFYCVQFIIEYTE